MRIEQLLGKEAEIILPMLTELRKSGIEKVEQILKKIKEGEVEKFAEVAPLPPKQTAPHITI